MEYTEEQLLEAKRQGRGAARLPGISRGEPSGLEGSLFCCPGSLYGDARFLSDRGVFLFLLY